MSLILPQPLHHVLAPKLPKVRLLAAPASNTADLSSYTFSGMDIGGFGGRNPFAAQESVIGGDAPMLAASGKTAILAIVHGEDAATTFSVTGVTIGGVASNAMVDRGGATQAISGAIRGWDSQALAGIANTDVVVTWSEVVTSCAVAIVEVSGLRSFGAAGIGSSLEGTLAVAGVTATESVPGGVIIVGTTCATGGGTERVEFWFASGATTDTGNSFSPILLYEANSAEIDFAAAYYLIASVPLQIAANATRDNVMVNWSGAGNACNFGVWVA